MTATAAILKCPFQVSRHGKGAPRRLVVKAKAEKGTLLPGRLPRVSRLLALAIRFEQLVCAGTIRTYAELADLGHVSRARISQIMLLLQLAPDIQEEILFLPPARRGGDAIHMWQVLPIAVLLDWPAQRRRWRALRSRQNKTTHSTSRSSQIRCKQRTPAAQVG
jgi:hypothetical protein